MPTSEHVIDVIDATFERDVIARSREVPVVVDFWAPWCGPSSWLEQVPLTERDAEYEAISLDVQAAQFPEVGELEARIEQDPSDLEARWQLGIKLANQRRFDEALDHLLQIVIRDRRFRDDAGRETMVRIFELMGPNTDEVRQWQKRLDRAMY